MRVKIYLEGAPDDRWMGHGLNAELGCMWLAESQEAAVARAPEAIRGFWLWLRRHGEPKLHIPEHIEPQVAEVFADVAGVGRSGGVVATFAPDNDPAGDEDMAAAVRRLGYARLDLMRLVGGLPDQVLDWHPPGPRRTVRQNLEHVRDYQYECTRRLDMELPPYNPAGTTLETLNQVMEYTVQAIHGLTHELRGGAVWAPDPPELWTARKWLRRLVEHECEHIEVVRHTLNLWHQQA